MTKSTITREQAQKIIVAADEVINALAGTNEDAHPDDSKKMCELWDDLNDRHAPPVVVRELARMALAAMDSEPVAEVLSNRPGNDTSTIDRALPVGTQLYRDAQPAPVVLDEMLCEFYEVDSWPDLVRELVKHVEQLQDSARRNVKPWEDTFPETLLPAYIERVKQADDACRAAMLAAAPQEVK
ncbi:hypothetical protein ACT02A_18865 [Klebsiella quasipneumoniae]|uniref:hypothetical protein n=1 Tax=Klebsiella quasipneumoniae TaxID=1463165 RepID=UPI00402B9DCA